MTDRLKVVVIDEDDARKYMIKDILPDYIDVSLTGMVDSAKDLIRPDRDGRKTDLVILNADNTRGFALSLFRWMKTGEAGLETIPVILLCEDAFADHILAFLELDEVEFYEGEIDPDLFFMQVMDVIERAEMAPDPVEEPSYIEKDSTRIQGHSVKPQGETEDTVRRSIVLQHDDQLKQLDQAIERGRKKQEKIKEIMELAIRYKEEKALAALEEDDDLLLDEEPVCGVDDLHRLEGPEALRMLEEEADVPEEQDEKKHTVVIVDYDPKNRKLCELFLKSSYQVVSFTSGMNAIDYFVKSKADLLLISFHMPILNGNKILDSIRWQPNGKKVPVIFMAEGDLESVRQQCKKEYVVGLLPKPVSKKVLQRSVDAVFSTIGTSRSQ